MTKRRRPGAEQQGQSRSLSLLLNWTQNNVLFFSFCPLDLWDFSSLARDGTQAPCIGSEESWSFNLRVANKSLHAATEDPPCSN